MKGKRADFTFSRIVALIILLIVLVFAIIFYGKIAEKISGFLGGLFS